MKNTLLTLGFIALTAASTASAVSISTGAASPWLVNLSPAVVESPIATPFWISNFSDGQWIGTASGDGNLAGGAAAGTYTFTLALGTWTGGAGSFTLQYAADNSIDWTPSTGIALAGATSCAVSDCFSSGNGAPRTLTGTFASNAVLSGTVNNAGTAPSPMGLLVVGVATLNSATPEPSTFGLFGIGGLALAIARFRRK